MPSSTRTGTAHESTRAKGSRPAEPVGRGSGQGGAPAQLAAEIRSLRESFDLSQARFEKLLGAGPDTVVRRDRGTVFQPAAADRLVRLLIAQREPADLLSGAGRRAVEVEAVHKVNHTVHIDPKKEEAPGVATPGGPRDIPVGMDGYSLPRSIHMAKWATQNVTRRRGDQLAPLI